MSTQASAEQRLSDLDIALPPPPTPFGAYVEGREDRQSALSERHAAGRRPRAAIHRTRRWRADGGGRTKGGGDCLPQRPVGGQGPSRLARQDNRRGEARRLHRDRRRLPRPSEGRGRSVRSPRQGLRHRACSRAVSSLASPACPWACRSKSSCLSKSRIIDRQQPDEFTETGASCRSGP